MQYTHKKNSGIVRALYICLIGIGFAIAFIPFKGLTGSIMSTVAMASIIVGMVVFMKYEATVFTIVINARETDYDFFISKAIGRRGAYACYFLVSDAIKVVKYDGKDSRAELEKEYSGIGFHYYVHSFKSKDRYAIIFLLDGKYDALVVELSKEALAQIEHFISVAKAVQERHVQSLHHDDEDKDIDVQENTSCTEVEQENVGMADIEASNEPTEE
jgi:hypothetical protein